MRRFLRVWFSRPARRILFVSLVAIFALASFQTQDQRLAMKYREAEMKQRMGFEDVHALPPNEALDLFALGNRHFLADMLFIRTYVYFIDHLYSDRIFAWLERYLDAVIHLDPINPSPYLWGSRWAKMGQIIDNAAVEKANDYARRALERLPDDWRFYLEIGFNLYFEYDPVDEVDQQEKIAEAIRYFSIGASLPGAQIDPNFIAEIHLRQNSYDMALLYAYQLYFDSSERQRQALRGRISFIEQQAVQTLNRMEETWKESFPYVPLRFAPMLGDPIGRSSTEGSDDRG